MFTTLLLYYEDYDNQFSKRIKPVGELKRLEVKGVGTLLTLTIIGGWGRGAAWGNVIQHFYSLT